MNRVIRKARPSGAEKVGEGGAAMPLNLFLARLVAEKALMNMNE